jgi:hypothetical protein
MSLTIAFEFPKHATHHPDVRAVKDGEGQITEAYLRGCKGCQNTASKCACPTPAITERLLWDSQSGVLTKMYLQHFKLTPPPKL